LLAAACLALVIFKGVSHTRAADAYRARAEAAYRTAFPEDRRVVNPRSQMQAKLAQLRGDASDRFLSLSAALSDSVRAVDAVSLSAVRFDGAREELQVDILFNSYADIEALKRAAAERGLAFDEGGQRQSGDRFTGDAVVRFK